MKRRACLRMGLAGAVSAGILPGGIAADEPKQPRSRLPIGFLGATHSHALEKLKIVLAQPDWEVVGVCESSAEARKSCEQAGAAIVSQDVLLDRARVVVVESAVKDHAPDALRALRAGKHIHVEKPPATDLAAMREMVALAREKRLLLQSGYMWRHNPGFHALFRIVREGWLGEVYQVRASMSNFLAPTRRPEWGQFAGGAMYEQGSHLIDPLVRLLGRPRAVTPFLRRHGAFSDDFKDNNLAVFEFDKALAVVLNSSLQPTKQPFRAFEVMGSNGYAALAPIEPPTLQLELAKAAGPYRAGTQTVEMPTYRRYEGDFLELAAAVRGERPLAVGLDEELLVQEVVLQASGM